MSRLQLIQDLRKQLEAKWGAHVVPRDLGEVAAAKRNSGNSSADYDNFRYAIPTGFPTLDRALGTGGVPRGRIVELCGDRSSGKTSLAMRLMAHALLGDGLVAYIDPTNTFHPPTAVAAGVHLPSLLLIRPRTAAQALEAVATLLQSEGFDLIVHDLAGGTAHPDTSSVAKLAALASKTRTLLLFLTIPSQRRTDWGGLDSRSSPLGFFSTLRLLVQRTEGVWYGEPSPPAPLPILGEGRTLTPTPPPGLGDGRAKTLTPPPILGEERLRTPIPILEAETALVASLPGLEEGREMGAFFVSLPLGLGEGRRVMESSPLPILGEGRGVRTIRLELAGYRLAVTVVKNKMGPYGMTLDLDISPWGATNTAEAVSDDATMTTALDDVAWSGVHGDDQDRLSLAASLHDLDGQAALTGAARSAPGHRRRAV